MSNPARRVRKRWKAVVQYKNNLSPLIPDDIFDVDEIEDLQELIEKGQDWNKISKIVITYNP